MAVRYISHNTLRLIKREVADRRGDKLCSVCRKYKPKEGFHNHPEMQIRWGDDNAKNLDLITDKKQLLPNNTEIEEEEEDEIEEAEFEETPLKKPRYVSPVIDPALEEQKELERLNAKERARMKAERTLKNKKLDSKKIVEQTYAAVDAFDEWCKEKGYGIIPPSDPRLPDIVDEYEDWKDAQKNIPEPKDADFDNEVGMMDEFDENAAGDAVDLETIIQDAHQNA